MVGQRLEGMLSSWNLESSDIPRVVGLVAAAKYAVGGVCVVAGFRYQPFRQIVLRKGLVLQSSPWAQQQRLRLSRALDRARKYPRKRVSQSLGIAHGGQPQFRNMLREAGQQLLLSKQIPQQQVIEKARHSWYGWTSRQYWHLADKLETTAETSKLLSHFSALTGMGPRKFALGLAEGLLLAKLATPITVSLSLFLAVHVFRRPVGAISAQEAPKVEDEVARIDDVE